MTVKRTGHGWTTHGNAESCRQVLEREVRPGIEARNLPGCRGLQLLSRDIGAELEFMTGMTLDSLQHVVRFQGENYEPAHVPDAAKAVLSRWDEVCEHYELVQSREQPCR